MTVSLDQWQTRLERHFESLAHKRAGSGFPIFVLEHGLSAEECEEIATLLRSRLKAGLPLSPHWLLWAIYTTERGYTYAGDEYWPSFEEQTPAWEHADRYKVAPWFRKFEKAYDGVVPSGPWAEHFRIIAWPITHAILPRYLQRQFARALYDLRYRLAGMSSASATGIGRLLAAQAPYGSTRFQEFLQQEELSGRIVLALFGTTPEEGKEPIHPPTLKRIVSDLEKVRSARDWLKETQRVVRDRFHGIGHGAGPTGYHPPSGREGAQATSTLSFGVRPNLKLHHRGGGNWVLTMEIPSFRPVAAVNSELQTFLRQTRCRLNGADDLKPRGWLLSGARKGALKSWPDASKPLLVFEKQNSAIDHILESECRHTPGPQWIFRISSDGTAREITGHIVRPGYDYILLTNGALPAPPAWTEPCRIECDGIEAFRLRVPSQLTADDTNWLDRLGLQVARTVRVWPAGLPGRNWDGEGNSDWLTSESPCFGMVHDHPIDAYTVSLNNAAQAVIDAGSVGYPTFVCLDPLPAGTHTLRVTARRSASLDHIGTPPAEGFVLLHVREPEPWTPGVLSHPGLIVTLDPPDADLDVFWRNETSLSVMGPPSHTVTCTVSLESGDGTELLREEVGQQLGLPITPGTWRESFGKFIASEQFAWRYLEAASGSLTINGETLGECILRFEHDALPLRWVLRRDHRNVLLRLVDDTGDEENPLRVFAFNMERPLKVIELPADKALASAAIDPPGAMFLARHGSFFDSVMVSTGLTGQGLKGLSISPHFPELQSASVNIRRVIRILALWQNARLSGFLANVRHQQVIEGLLAGLYGALCGENWRRAEATFKLSPTSRQSIDGLQAAVEKRPSFAAVLRRDYTNMNGNGFAHGCRWFADVAKRYRVCTDPDTCTFALKLASAPAQLLRMNRDELDQRLEEVRSRPAILRGARMLALLSANPDASAPGQLLPRWAWR